jgi:ribonuclease HII
LWCARDSKQIGEHQREQLAGDLLRNFDVGIGIADEHEIAQLNILQASLRAMCRAMDALKSAPELALVDGNQPIPHPTRSIPVIHGDARIHLISAASIVAKVERDRLMRELDLQYPAYGFARHFGYPTAEHRAKLAALGPCPIHRRTFRGVREHFDAVA